MQEIEYKVLENEIKSILENNNIWILATSSNNKVAARSMCIANEGLRIFFQTDKTFVKYRQIQENRNVALCYGNVQIEGSAKIKGHPYENNNILFKEKFQKLHKNAFILYSHLKNAIVVEVEPIMITMWKYEELKPFRDFLDIINKKAYREYYCINE